MDNSWSSNPSGVFDEGRQLTNEEVTKELAELVSRIEKEKEFGEVLEEEINKMEQDARNRINECLLSPPNWEGIPEVSWIERLKTAWHVLRGRPLAYRMRLLRFDGGFTIHSRLQPPGGYVTGCRVDKAYEHVVRFHG